MFAYCNNNPVKYTDYNGQDPTESVDIDGDEIIDCLQLYDEDFNTPWDRTDESLLTEWKEHHRYRFHERAKNIDFDNAEEGEGFWYFLKKAIRGFFGW